MSHARTNLLFVCRLRLIQVLTRKPIANAKLSARQPRYIGRNSLNRPPLRIAQKYQRNLYIVERYFQRPTIPLLTMRVYLHSFSRCCLPTCQLTQNSEKIWTYSSSRSPKVDDFGTNRRRIYELLLVIRPIGPNNNFGLILHRFWDTASYWLKNCVFFIPLSYSAHPLPMFPLEFPGEVKCQKTRVMGLYFVLNVAWS